MDEWSVMQKILLIIRVYISVAFNINIIVTAIKLPPCKREIYIIKGNASYENFICYNM